MDIRTHHKLARRYDDHLGTDVNVLEPLGVALARIEPAVRGAVDDLGIHLNTAIGSRLARRRRRKTFGLRRQSDRLRHTTNQSSNVCVKAGALQACGLKLEQSADRSRQAGLTRHWRVIEENGHDRNMRASALAISTRTKSRSSEFERFWNSSIQRSPMRASIKSQVATSLSTHSSHGTPRGILPSMSKNMSACGSWAFNLSCMRSAQAAESFRR